MDSECKLIITTTFNKGSWLLFFTKPIVEINGVENKNKWGRHVYPVEPGEYEVKVYYPYLYNYYSCLDSLKVHLKEGDEISLKYNGTHGIWKGKLTLEESENSFAK